MENLPYPILTDVLDVISAANESKDCDLVRWKVLDALFHAISAEGGIFFLPDGKGFLTNIVLKNLDKAYCDSYKNYFHRFDPLRLTCGMDKAEGPRLRERTFSYDSLQPSEYYNDFLKPQKIHHKLIINLAAEKELFGRIVLTRPRSYGRFNKKEIRTVKTISPYLAHALAHNELRKKLMLRGNIIEYIERQTSASMVLLDEELKVIYRNNKAEDLFGRLKAAGSPVNLDDLTSSMLFRDCQDFKTVLDNRTPGVALPPRHSVIEGPNRTRLDIVSRVLDKDQDWEGRRLLMVSIKDQSPDKVNHQKLMDKYQLSKRETEVVSLLFLGLKNAQIAKKLFVSEVTVKKHLQNIYEKVGVSNRTSLINRIVTE